MLKVATLEQIGSLILAISSIILAGLQISQFSYVGYSATAWLSKYTRINEPDPVAFKRAWRRFYEQEFQPFGEAVKTDRRSRKMNQILAYLSISVIAIAVSMSLYLISSATILSTMVATYYWAGFVPDWSSAFEPIAAICVLFAIVVIQYAAENPRQMAYQ